MAQSLNLKIAGLFTNPNQFSEIPEGALLRADNIQIDKGSVAEPRRGQAKYGQLPSSYTGAIDALYDFNGTLLVSYNNKLAKDNGSGTFTDFSGTYTPPTGNKIKSTQANKNFYFNTNSNIQKLTSPSSTPFNAGVPRALDGFCTISSTTGFLPHNSTSAYRFVWGYKDTNDNLLLGAPSGRVLITNTIAGSDKAVDVTLYIPDNITTSYFFQAYRSINVASGEPSDDLQLVYEAFPTSGEITAGLITFTDIVPDDLQGASLYTNPTQQGILQSNDEPPFCIDLCTYKSMTFYGNTKSRQNIYINLLSTSGTAGLALNDTITINGLTYTAKAAESVVNREFQRFTAGTASSNITDTARSLVKIINLAQADVSAYYVSGFNELPGKIWIQANLYSLAQFQINSSKPTAFNPVLPVSGTNDVNLTTNDENPNRVFYSKLQQPEAVPLLNYVDCGSRLNPILRIIPLRDSVFVLKLDGIFRIIGEDPTSLRVSLFDNTVKLLATESAVEINNQIYCFTDQGVCAISDNGVEVLSRPIEDQIFPLELQTNFGTLTFGISYEVDRKYILYTKTLDSDTAPTQAYVYNFFTQAWTKYLTTRTCGIVFDARLFLGGSDGFIYRERKALTNADYVDDQFIVTIVSKSGNNILLVSAANAQINMVLRQGSNFSVITNVAINTITVEDASPFVAGTAVVAQAIESLLEWSQNDAQNPGVLKHWREFTTFFRTANFSSIEVGLSSNFDETVEFTEVSPTRSDLWGSFPWGSLPWGTSAGLNYPIRTYIPLKKRRASWVMFRVRSKKAQNYFAIQGLSVMFDQMSERFK